MRGLADLGVIAHREEVIPCSVPGDNQTYFKGILAAPGFGRVETPPSLSKREAQTMLDGLKDKHFPKSKSDGISAAQAAQFAAALA